MVQNIIKELELRGIVAVETEIVKNGVSVKGLRLGNDKVAPVVYYEEIVNRYGEELAVDEIERLYEEHKNPPICVDEVLEDMDFIREHIVICLQRKGNEPLVKKAFNDEIEEYIRISNGDYSIKVTTDLAKHWGIDIDELFQIAMANTEKSFTISHIVDSLGVPDEIAEEMKSQMNMYVVTNSNKCFGASSILCTDKIRDFAKEIGVNRFVAIPSSIHEFILIPNDTSIMLDMVKALINEVNNNEVDQVEQLGDSAFVLEV